MSENPTLQQGGVAAMAGEGPGAVWPISSVEERSAHTQLPLFCRPIGRPSFPCSPASKLRGIVGHMLSGEMDWAVGPRSPKMLF